MCFILEGFVYAWAQYFIEDGDVNVPFITFFFVF